MEEKERKSGEVGMITRKMDMQYNESRIITAILKVVATAELYDPDATEETIRYCVEQDLEDVGFDVSVELLKEQEPLTVLNIGFQLSCYSGNCPSCGKMLNTICNKHYCGECGQAVKWDDITD